MPAGDVTAGGNPIIRLETTYAHQDRFGQESVEPPFTAEAEALVEGHPGESASVGAAG